MQTKAKTLVFETSSPLGYLEGWKSVLRISLPRRQKSRSTVGEDRRLYEFLGIGKRVMLVQRQGDTVSRVGFGEIDERQSCYSLRFQ